VGAGRSGGQGHRFLIESGPLMDSVERAARPPDPGGSNMAWTCGWRPGDCRRQMAQEAAMQTVGGSRLRAVQAQETASIT
jgi:hypothetical protein